MVATPTSSSDVAAGDVRCAPGPGSFWDIPVTCNAVLAGMSDQLGCQLAFRVRAKTGRDVGFLTAGHCKQDTRRWRVCAASNLCAEGDVLGNTFPTVDAAFLTSAEARKLARLSADDMHTQLEQAQLEVARLTVEERQHEALVKLNQTELNQETELFKDGLTSKRQLERAQNKLEGSVQELEKLRLATQTARSRVEAVQIESEKCVIRAPLTGVVTHRFAKLGATITRNDKLFEVAQLSQLEVKIQVPQSAQTQLSPGCLLKLSLSDDERIVAQARITRLDPIVDVLSNTRGYWAAVSGGKGLVPGLAVLVHLPHMAHAGVATTLSVPRAAFPAASGLRPDTPQVLFVVDSDHAQSRVVQVQAIVGEQVEIKSGLNIGERVILTPPAELKAGDLVRIR